MRSPCTTNRVAPTLHNEKKPAHSKEDPAQPTKWIVVVVQSLNCVQLFGPHELQHARLPCPSSSPELCSNSCPLSQWYHPTISSSVALFSFCFQSFPASRSFLVSQLFISDGQSIKASASASVLPMSIQGWFPLRLTGLISFLYKGVSGVYLGLWPLFH